MDHFIGTKLERTCAAGCSLGPCTNVSMEKVSLCSWMAPVCRVLLLSDSFLSYTDRSQVPDSTHRTTFFCNDSNCPAAMGSALKRLVGCSGNNFVTFVIFIEMLPVTFQSKIVFLI